MLTRNFHQLQAEVQRHVEADHVRQGSYKPGFISCLAGKKNDPRLIEREYGIPQMISRVAEPIFKGLPPSEAAAFLAALLDAIECNGKDLSLVGWQFLAAELRSLPTAPAGVQEKIDCVVKGMNLLAEGKEWPVSAYAAYAYATTYAYAAASDSAASDSAASAYAAAYAVYADSADDFELAAISIHKAVTRARQATADGGGTILARRRQRNTLLRLISEAPVETN